MTTHTSVKPWYVEPWPWLLMAGPVTVIVACAVTVWLAIVSNDGLVSDDYYKQGLAVNQTLSRDAAAKALGYRARVTFRAESGIATVNLEGMAQPAHLILRVVHPTRPGLDFALQLAQTGEGVYQSQFSAPATGRWQLILENRERTWRLVGDMHLPVPAAADLAPR